MEHSVQSVKGRGNIGKGTDKGSAAATTQANHRACIGACFECGETCKSCADASLSVDMEQAMVNFLRLCLECADACNATGYLLLRQFDINESNLQTQLEKCIAACQCCATECGFHAETMEQWRVCSQSCQNCAVLCESLHG